jgi:hypothetical protein
MKRVLVGLVGLIVLVGVPVIETVTLASPAVGVTPTLIGRGTYDPFKVRTGPHSLLDFQAKAKSPLDIVVRTHDYAVGSSTGWHTHPGPVFITVLEGTVTFYDVEDETCSPTIVTAGQGYLDTGHGHIGRNESGLPAKDVTVILAPVGLPFRGELPAPGPHCSF